MPWLKKQNTVIIAIIAGNTPEDYCAMAEKLSETDVDMIELNISCPNVKSGGVQFGTSCESVGAITAAVKKYCKKPLIVKLSPNVTDIASIAQSAEANGAAAISEWFGRLQTQLKFRLSVWAVSQAGRMQSR